MDQYRRNVMRQDEEKDYQSKEARSQRKGAIERKMVYTDPSKTMAQSDVVKSKPTVMPYGPRTEEKVKDSIKISDRDREGKGKAFYKDGDKNYTASKPPARDLGRYDAD